MSFGMDELTTGPDDCLRYPSIENPWGRRTRALIVAALIGSLLAAGMASLHNPPEQTPKEKLPRHPAIHK
ncbi:MAG: hypothetical protein HOO67_04565 [Candidatus Peribacteraceae bacterium]|nr:hypothetical protein [Candidatus Peribacteraceae bacterium]